MDETLDRAPCGFLSFADDGTIREVNATLLDLLGYEREELAGRHVETLLTVGSRIFYQTHLFPLVRLHGRADEIFLILRPKGGGDAGVLANAVRRERGGASVIDCVMMHVQERRATPPRRLGPRGSTSAAASPRSSPPSSRRTPPCGRRSPGR